MCQRKAETEEKTDCIATLLTGTKIAIKISVKYCCLKCGANPIMRTLKKIFLPCSVIVPVSLITIRYLLFQKNKSLLKLTEC